MLRNLGGWKFADVTDASGTRDPGSKTIGAVALDYDGDGKTDFYVANDQWRNTLFHNEGGGVFRDVSDETGTGYPEEGSVTAFGRRTRSGMGLVAADFDGDGRPGPLRHELRERAEHALPQRRGRDVRRERARGLRRRPRPRPAALEVGDGRARLGQRREGRPRRLERPDPLALLHGPRRLVQPEGEELRRGREELRAAAVPLPQRERAGHDDVPGRLRRVGRPRPARDRRARALGRATSTATARKTSSSTRSTSRRSS